MKKYNIIKGVMVTKKELKELGFQEKFFSYYVDAIITLKEVHNRVALTPLNHLTNMINENDDAETADVILQTVFLQDIVYG